MEFTTPTSRVKTETDLDTISEVLIIVLVHSYLFNTLWLLLVSELRLELHVWVSVSAKQKEIPTTKDLNYFPTMKQALSSTKMSD